MMDLIKKTLCILLSFLMISLPVSAKEKINAVANIQQEFSLAEVPNEVFIKTSEEDIVFNGVTIPGNSILEAEVLQAEQERRWHKSGVIVCKLKNYKPQDSDEAVDVSEKNIYLLVRKYDAINGKDAAILTTEIVLTQAAGIVGSCFIIFAPVDIAYFFTKGAIQRDRDPNWFKSGVSCAYDNSIFWFWLKGKPIELEQDGTVKLKSIKEKKALKLSKRMEVRNDKRAVKKINRQFRAEIKQNKKEIKEFRKYIEGQEQNGIIYFEINKQMRKNYKELLDENSKEYSKSSLL